MRNNCEYDLDQRRTFSDDDLENHADLKDLQITVLESAKHAFRAIIGQEASDKILSDQAIAEIEPTLDSKELNEAYRIAFAYGKYGILRDYTVQPAERAKFIEDKIERVNAFYTGMSEHFKDIKGQIQLKNVLNMAQARWALDHNKSIPIDGLVLLADVGIQGIRNLISKKKLRQETRNYIFHNDASSYLKDKRVFYNSIWQTQEGFTPTDNEPEDQGTEEYVLVPVSREGIVFHPGNRFECGYILGVSEKQVGSFKEALNELTQMPRPKWMHKRTDGGRSVISGPHWVRMTVSDLKAYQDNPAMRHPIS